MSVKFEQNSKWVQITNNPGICGPSGLQEKIDSCRGQNSLQSKVFSTAILVKQVRVEERWVWRLNLVNINCTWVFLHHQGSNTRSISNNFKSKSRPKTECWFDGNLEMRKLFETRDLDGRNQAFEYRKERGWTSKRFIINSTFWIILQEIRNQN